MKHSEEDTNANLEMNRCRLALMEKYENRRRSDEESCNREGNKIDVGFIRKGSGVGDAGMKCWRRAGHSHKNRLVQTLALRRGGRKTAVIEASGNNPSFTAAPASSQPLAGVR